MDPAIAKASGRNAQSLATYRNKGGIREKKNVKRSPRASAQCNATCIVRPVGSLTNQVVLTYYHGWIKWYRVASSTAIFQDEESVIQSDLRSRESAPLLSRWYCVLVAGCGENMKPHSADSFQDLLKRQRNVRGGSRTLAVASFATTIIR